MQENEMRVSGAVRLLSLLKHNESGAALISTLVAVAIAGILAAAFLSGLATATTAIHIADELTVAESLARSEMEYVRDYAYQYDATVYPVDPLLDIPTGWVVPTPAVELVHATDDGIQKITVSVEHNGKTVLTIEDYKVDR